MLNNKVNVEGEENIDTKLPVTITSTYKFMINSHLLSVHDTNEFITIYPWSPLISHLAISDKTVHDLLYRPLFIIGTGLNCTSSNSTHWH